MRLAPEFRSLAVRVVFLIVIWSSISAALFAQQRREREPNGIDWRFIYVDDPQHIFVTRRPADFLSRRERSMVFGEGYDRLLQAHDRGEWG